MNNKRDTLWTDIQYIFTASPIYNVFMKLVAFASPNEGVHSHEIFVHNKTNWFRSCNRYSVPMMVTSHSGCESTGHINARPMRHCAQWMNRISSFRQEGVALSKTQQMLLSGRSHDNDCMGVFRESVTISKCCLAKISGRDRLMSSGGP